jgi:hypothetical protein
MKIVIEKSKPGKLIRVTSAKYLSDYVLRVGFNDGTERAVDFKPFLTKTTHPEISKYKREKAFRKFKVKAGNIDWNDYELIFPVDSLYKGEIM